MDTDPIDVTDILFRPQEFARRYENVQAQLAQAQAERDDWKRKAEVAADDRDAVLNDFFDGMLLRKYYAKKHECRQRAAAARKVAQWARKVTYAAHITDLCLEYANQGVESAIKEAAALRLGVVRLTAALETADTHYEKADAEDERLRKDILKLTAVLEPLIEKAEVAWAALDHTEYESFVSHLGDSIDIARAALRGQPAPANVMLVSSSVPGEPCPNCGQQLVRKHVGSLEFCADCLYLLNWPNPSDGKDEENVGDALS